jgi:hypothetical protein
VTLPVLLPYPGCCQRAVQCMMVMVVARGTPVDHRLCSSLKRRGGCRLTGGECAHCVQLLLLTLRITLETRPLTSLNLRDKVGMQGFCQQRRWYPAQGLSATQMVPCARVVSNADGTLRKTRRECKGLS